MTETIIHKKYDLMERTFTFAERVRTLLHIFPTNIDTAEDKKQLIRSSGSVAANYIEANECLGPKDFSMRIKICRKEARESQLWLRLLKSRSPSNIMAELDALIQEAIELSKIFGAIVYKLKNRNN